MTDQAIRDLQNALMKMMKQRDAMAAKLAKADTRAERWRVHALAWERYDEAFMTGTEEETDRAKEVLEASYGQLYEFGDLP